MVLMFYSLSCEIFTKQRNRKIKLLLMLKMSYWSSLLLARSTFLTCNYFCLNARATVKNILNFLLISYLTYLI